MPMHVLDDDDRVVDHEADSQHHRQQRQQIDRKPHEQHEKAAADQRQRHSQTGHDGRAHRSERQVNHEQYDEQCFAQGLEHFLDRIFDVLARVVRDACGHDGGKLLLDFLHRAADPSCDRQGIRSRSRFDRNYRTRRAIEPANRIVAFGAQFDACDILEPDEGRIVAPHDEIAEILYVCDVGGRGQVSQHIGALYLSGRGKKVVGIQYGGDLGR